MLNPDFKDMLSAFVAERVEFLVVGAYALAAHGAPRATGDLDFWIRRDTTNADRVFRALVTFGAPVAEISRRDLVTPDRIVQIGVEPTRIDILTSIDAVEFDEAWPNRLIANVGGIDVPLIGRKELIRNKRAVGRPRDLADIEALDAVRKRRRKRKKGD